MSRADLHFDLLPVSCMRQGKLVSFTYAKLRPAYGAQKLVNRWLKCLLTRKGSDLTAPTYGTHFSDLVGGNVTTPDDIIDVVTLAINDCNDQIFSMDRRRMAPEAERLHSATLEEVVAVSRTEFRIRVILKNAARDRTTLDLPLSV
jgi:hypothetical protein